MHGALSYPDTVTCKTPNFRVYDHRVHNLLLLRNSNLRGSNLRSTNLRSLRSSILHSLRSSLRSSLNSLSSILCSNLRSSLLSSLRSRYRSASSGYRLYIRCKSSSNKSGSNIWNYRRGWVVATGTVASRLDGSGQSSWSSSYGSSYMNRHENRYG